MSKQQARSNPGFVFMQRALCESWHRGSTVQQSVDYRYNIRGWMQTMNNSKLTNDGGVTNDDYTDLFGMELAYDTAFGTGVSTGNTVQFNGNISAMKWSSNLALGAVKDVAYNYSYDPLNRILSATYLKDTLSSWSNPKNWFSESGYAYDQNGNITALTRNGSTGATIDGLTYNYGTTISNQLGKVSDSATGSIGAQGFTDGTNTGNDYSYDGNGNLTQDQNKTIDSIKYNYLNLPARVKKHTGELIKYTYDAAGRKLTQQVYNASGTLTKTTEYDGEFIYQNDTLQFINHAEGRVVMKTGTPEYQYHLKDHLGNVRLTFTTKITSQQVTATFESSSQATEAQNFQNYPSGSGINNVSTFNHTTGGTSSEYLNGGYMGMVGIGKSYSVMAGDQLQIQAYAKYVTHTGSSDIAAFANALLTAFLGSTTVGVDGTPSYAINKWVASEGALVGDGSSDETDPRIFVTILLFDRNYNFLDVAYQQLASTSGWGSLTATYTVKQAGYAYMYVSNEQQVLTDVYFDDITISFTPSAVVETTDYYPGGAIASTFSRQSFLPNKYRYQRKEYQDDLGLNLYDFHARQYDPWTLRTTSVDPHAQNYLSMSPYSWAGNNPMHFIDPSGMDLVVGGDKQFRKETKQELQKLTTDKVKIDKNGEVHLKARNGTGKELGTATIRQLVNSDKGHGIFKTDGKNSTSVYPGGATNPDVSNGKGATAIININPNSKVEATTTSGESKVTPSEIVLGHELIHASHIDNGSSVPGTADPKGSSYDPDLGGAGAPLTNEEINTRQAENVLRKEQGMTDMRAAPVGKDSGIVLPEIIIK